MKKYVNIPYLSISIRKKMIDFRTFYIEYPHGHWVFKRELEEDFKRWGEMPFRKLSFLEVNFKWWHDFVNKRYRRKYGIDDIYGQEART